MTVRDVYTKCFVILSVFYGTIPVLVPRSTKLFYLVASINFISDDNMFDWLKARRIIYISFYFYDTFNQM